ncbi:MAG: HAMP domain-containing histidine kinase [Candidatus Riflebacteria bacterium]|nr:HAMP domain-containing histidine kinase [Candidatus Riflebacteria bacterium]
MGYPDDMFPDGIKSIFPAGVHFLPKSLFGRLFLAMLSLSFCLIISTGAYFLSQAYGVLDQEANRRLLSGAGMIAAGASQFSGKDTQAFFEELFDATFGTDQGMGWLCHIYWADLQEKLPRFRAIISLRASDAAQLAPPTAEDLEDLLDVSLPDLEAGRPAFPDPMDFGGPRRFKIILMPLVDADHLLTGIVGIEADMRYLELSEWLRSTLWRSGFAALIASIAASWLIARSVARRIDLVVANLDRTAARETLSETPPDIREFELLHRGMIRLGETISAGDKRIRETTDAKMAELSFTGAAIAHEVRNPLAAVELHLGLIRRRFSPVGDDLESFLEIEEGIGRMKRLTDSFLAYSRREKPEPVRIELAEWFQHWLCERRRLGNIFEVNVFAESTALQASLKTSLVISPLAVNADPGMWRQIFDNLLNNALAARPEGLVINITAGFANDNSDRIRLTFSDNGPGLSDELEKSLFTPFASGRREGHGIGLAMVRKLVEAHHGSILHRRSDTGGVEYLIEVPGQP